MKKCHCCLVDIESHHTNCPYCSSELVPAGTQKKPADHATTPISVNKDITVPPSLEAGKRRSVWWYVIIMLWGAPLTYLSFKIWYEPTRIKSFVPPGFEELTISSGIISFHKPWRGSGGTSYLQLDDGETLKLWCGGPFHTMGCYEVKENGKWVDKEKELLLERVKVWWLPAQGDNDRGTIYQLEAKGRLFFSYAEKKEEYQDDFRRGSSETPFLFILCLLMFVLYPTIQIVQKMYRS